MKWSSETMDGLRFGCTLNGRMVKQLIQPGGILKKLKFFYEDEFIEGTGYLVKRKWDRSWTR
jgi:hypothetical protein